MVTMGSQASGDTGLKICTKGLMAALAVGDRPEAMPKGTAIRVPKRKPMKTVLIEVRIWPGKVGLPA